MTYKTDDLQFDYAALEPHIDEETMRIHHDKHHVAYTTKLNAAIENHPELFEKSAEELLLGLDTIPKDIRTAVRNNGGGHVNHNFFWSILGPENHEPMGKIKEAIEETFGSFEAFKDEFSKATVSTILSTSASNARSFNSFSPGNVWTENDRPTKPWCGGRWGAT